MRYQNPLLKQMLAAEYVLGTLRGRARRRFERLLAVRPDLRDERRYWETRLSALQAGFRPQAPREIVWTEIERRTRISTVTALPRRDAPPPQLLFWKTWSMVATAASLVLAFSLYRELSAPPPPAQIVRVEVPVPQALPYVAMLQPGGGADARWVVSLSPERKLIRVAATGGYPINVNSECLELWIIGEDGKPLSLGVLPNSGEGQMAMPGGVKMPAKPVLAVSREPIGGSPTGAPTGPVILTSPALRAS